MFLSILMRIRNWVAKPIVLVLIFGLFLAAWLWRGNRLLTELLTDTSFSAVAERNKQELMNHDPQAAAILARIDDERAQRALSVATYSANADNRRRSILAEMAAEARATEALPYRARIAKLALDKRDLQDNEAREAFLASHAAVCETLTIAGDWGSSSEYMRMLEQASNLPSVWQLVRYDPLALVLWSQLGDDDQSQMLLSFYHRNRDWLAEPLAALDLSGSDSEWTVQTALAKLAQHEDSLKKAVEDGELGIYALAAVMTHGKLIDLCYERHRLDPSEVIPIILFNPDILGDQEGDAEWIRRQADWLATIRQRHIVVWLAAGMSPLALQLHTDAPNVSDTLLERYGADDIGPLIYQHFEEEDRIAAAAKAIDRFGDLAIYVFARYEDEVFIKRLGDYLVDREIGIRIIPFVVRFGDDAFNRVEDKKAWVDRYFNDDGTSKIDPLEWIQYLPGGSAVHVPRNWAKGYPCEWSEIGWAAVDAADIALAVATFGTSKVVTTPGKAAVVGGSKAKRTAAQTAAKGARATASADAGVKGARAARNASWKRTLAEFRAGRGQMSRVAEMASAIRVGTVLAGDVIWGSVRLAAAPMKIAYGGGKGALDAWKGLSPARKVWIYRGLLATGLFITVSERTVPNLDKISSGVGELIGKAAAGLFTMSGDALASALAAFSDQLTGGAQWVKRLLYWAVAGVLTLLTLRFLFLATRARKQLVVVRSDNA